MWRTEYASWLKWGDLAVAMIVGGLEALLKTERHGSTRQFTTRVPALAAELGFIWLQYWVFYYFNPDPVGLFGPVHEGDWEMVQVGLTRNLTPDEAVYAQHNGGQRCDWMSVERAGDIPVVYVAEHSHASYFGPDRIPNPFDAWDHADGQGGGVLADLEQITETAPAWVAWPGSWGDSGASPQGPGFQGDKWSDPSDWADGLSEC